MMMIVRCRFCQEQIQIDESTSNPYDQLKRHNGRHIGQLMRLVTQGGVGQLIDCMTFESPTHPYVWRAHQQKLFDYVMSPEVFQK